MAGHKGQVVGYARVSATDQLEARQLEALGSVDRLFAEKVNGKNTNDRARPQEMLIYVHDGDKVRVKSPDRLARSRMDFLALVERLKAPQIRTHRPGCCQRHRPDSVTTRHSGWPLRGHSVQNGTVASETPLRLLILPPVGSSKSNSRLAGDGKLGALTAMNTRRAEKMTILGSDRTAGSPGRCSWTTDR